MNSKTFSRRMLIMIAIVFTLVMAACSPSASPTASAPGGTSGNPADAVRDFYNALFTGGDAASYVCNSSGVDAAQLQETYKAAAAAFADATIDTVGLVFTSSNVTADKADVAISGTMTVEMSGVKTQVPMEVPRIPVVNEGGSWKICG